MMKTKQLKLLIVIGVVLLLCGCWNYSELNDLAITTSLGIDKEDDKYLVSVMIANAKSAQISAKEGQSQTTVLEGKGKTLSEALENIDLKSPKQIYINHLSAIVISDQVAKEGINKISDFLLREPESRKKFYLLITKEEKASDVLKILTPLESLPSQSIASNVQEAKEYQAVTNDMIYSVFINDVIERGIHPVLSSISIEGKKDEAQKYQHLEQSQPDAVLKLGPLGIFKDDKLIGFATKKESEGTNIILNKVDKSIVEIKYNGGYIVSHLESPNTKLNISFKNNKPQIDLKIKAGGSIAEVNCDIDLTDPKEIAKIKTNTEKELKKTIRQALNMAQKKYQTDIFGFGLAFYHKYPNQFKKLEKHWDHDTFANMDINVSVEIDIETKGSLEQSIRKEEA